MIGTKYETPISNWLFSGYLTSLIDRVFKILPLRETEEPTLPVYIESLLIELIGFSELVTATNTDSRFLSLMAILQYLASNPECEVDIVKREVFHAISICNKIRRHHFSYMANEPDPLEVGE